MIRVYFFLAFVICHSVTASLFDYKNFIYSIKNNSLLLKLQRINRKNGALITVITGGVFFGLIYAILKNKKIVIDQEDQENVNSGISDSCKTESIHGKDNENFTESLIKGEDLPINQTNNIDDKIIDEKKSNENKIFIELIEEENILSRVKTQYPNEERIIEIDNFFTEKQKRRSHNDHNDYARSFSCFSFIEILCYLIHENLDPNKFYDDGNRHGRLEIWIFNWYNDYVPWDLKDLVSIDQRIVAYDTLLAAINYCLVENTQERLSCLFKIITIDNNFCLIPCFQKICEYAINKKNHELLGFCEKYFIDFVTTKKHLGGFVSELLKYKGPNPFFDDFYDFINHLEVITNLLKINGVITSNFYDMIGKAILQSFGLLEKNPVILDRCIEITKMSPEFENKFKKLLQGDLNNNDDFVFAEYIYKNFPEKKDELWNIVFETLLNDPIKLENGTYDKSDLHRIVHKFLFIVTQNENRCSNQKLFEILVMTIDKYKNCSFNYSPEKQCSGIIYECARAINYEALDENVRIKHLDTLNQVNLYNYQNSCINNSIMHIYNKLLKILDDAVIKQDKDRDFELSIFMRYFLSHGYYCHDPFGLYIDGYDIKNFFSRVKEEDSTQFFKLLPSCIITEEQQKLAEAIIKHYKLKVSLTFDDACLLSSHEVTHYKKFLENCSELWHWFYLNMFSQEEFKSYFSKITNPELAFTTLYRCYLYFIDKKSFSDGLLDRFKEDILSSVFEHPNLKYLLPAYKSFFHLFPFDFNVLKNHIFHCNSSLSKKKLRDTYFSNAQKEYFDFLFSYTMAHSSNSKYKRKCIKYLVALFKIQRIPIDDLFFDQNSPDVSFYNAVAFKKLNHAKALLLSEQEEKFTGYYKGWGIFHDLILQERSDDLIDLVHFLLKEGKTTILTKLLGHKCKSETDLTKQWYDHTPISITEYFMRKNKELIDEKLYHHIEDTEKESKEYEWYAKVHHVLTAAEMIVKSENKKNIL